MSGWKQFRVEEELDIFYRTEIEIYHDDCTSLCGWCNGSGEGAADGTTCIHCKGRGELQHDGEDDYWFEVEWAEEDLSDLEIIDGAPAECEECGYNFIEDIKDELRAMRDVY